MNYKLHRVLEAYGLDPETCAVKEFGSGLINHTWKVHSRKAGEHFILQRINHQVFKKPADIAANIQCIATVLQERHPGYLFVAPLRLVSGENLYYDNEQGYFRMFPFVENSFSIDTVQTPEQAFEGARQFALFTRLLSDLDVRQLKITLPDFHNLSLRYEQFEQAVLHGDPERIRESQTLIDFLQDQKDIVLAFESIKKDPAFRIRATHHDTKISNVLFDNTGKGLCIIDLDTVMPGHFISDVGDMMRTYLCPVSEEETDFSKIAVRDDFFQAIISGYLREMGTELTAVEKEHFVYAGKFMIYMQALRFLTDYLQNDRYYTPRYEKHNLVRAGNQAELLKRLMERFGPRSPIR